MRPVTSKECPRFDSCSAPICPMDEQSLECSGWFPDEDICVKEEFSKLPWLRNQRKISRKANDLEGYFNLRMLSRDCIIGRAISGIDPDSENSEDFQTERWLEKHPVKVPVSEEERQILRNRMVGYQALKKSQSAAEMEKNEVQPQGAGADNSAGGYLSATLRVNSQSH